MAVKTVKGEDGHSYVRVSPSKANKIMHDVQLYTAYPADMFVEFGSPVRLRGSWPQGSGPLRGEYWIRVSTDKPEYTPDG